MLNLVVAMGSKLLVCPQPVRLRGVQMVIRIVVLCVCNLCQSFGACPLHVAWMRSNVWEYKEDAQVMRN